MERRIIQVENPTDQAGIAASLRRAFAAQPAPSRTMDDDPCFAALLKKLN